MNCGCVAKTVRLQLSIYLLIFRHINQLKITIKALYCALNDKCIHKHRVKGHTAFGRIGGKALWSHETIQVMKNCTSIQRLVLISLR